MDRLNRSKKMKRTFFVVLLTCLIGMATWPTGMALAGEEATVTADGGLSFTAGLYGSGPRVIDVATDGNASIKFLWFHPTSRDSIVRVDPAGTFGNSSYALRTAYPPRYFQFSGDGPDSAYVDLDGASEVIVTW
jgi:hypothetical protein